jgi:transposase, IS30 family
MEKAKEFSHITENDRDRIQILLEQKYLQKDIAKVLNKSTSAISREIARRKLSTGEYKSLDANAKARVKRSNSKYQGMKVEKDALLQKRIILEIKDGRSPDEIAGMLRLEGFKIGKGTKSPVGKDAIYKWLYSVYGDKYCKYLCTKRKYKKKHKKKAERTLIPNRVALEWRPNEGIHAQADTLVSGKISTAAASMIVLEKTKLMLGNRLSSMKPEGMKNSVNHLLKNIPVDDLTLDNGIENRLHEQFLIPAYFCTPHSPWEKPLVEQSIGLLRKWCLPKGTNLETVTELAYQNCLNFLNHKKRKSLGYKSAYEVSLECGIITEIPERVAVQYRI